MIRISTLSLQADKTSTADIELAPGTINVVLGRNRSGKTNFCRLLAGLPSQASASISMEGSVALVFQAFVNYPHWTVAKNIASPMLAAGKVEQGRVQELADLMRIGHLLERLPGELSGGQQQRLAIARALAKSPSLLVMDEPFVNIDYKLRESLLLELRTLANETGVCFVYATSDPRDAISLADQLFLIGDHEFIQSGDPLSLYQKPVNFAAADLMSDPGVNTYGEGKFVRPEHIRVSGQSDESRFCVAAEITGVETNGAETFVHADVSVPEGNLTWVARQPGMLNVAVGEQSHLLVDHLDVLSLAGSGG